MSPRQLLLLLVEFDQIEFSVAEQEVNTRIQTMCVYYMIYMYEGRGLSFGPTNRALTTLASFFFFDIHSPPSSFLAKTIYNNN